MREHWPFTGDAVEVTGLSVMLDEDEPLPYLELGLRHAGHDYRAVILVAEEEWAVSVRDVSGRQLFAEPELYPTQAGAILAAMLAVLHSLPDSDAGPGCEHSQRQAPSRQVTCGDASRRRSGRSGRSG